MNALNPPPPAEYAAVAQEVLRRCDELARFSEDDRGLTRTFLSPPMHDVHRVVGTWMKCAGMRVHVDAAGNIHGILPGQTGREIVIGSHLDTVPNAGRYDGILGVLLGIAAAEAFAAERLPLSLRVIGFSEEEGVRFRSPFLGSKACAGALRPELLDLEDDAGITAREAIRNFGLDPQHIPDAVLPFHRIAAFFEVHIEQGPLLEQANSPIGIVSGIAGQSKLALRLRGRADHAGTTPQSIRRDAFLGAAEFALAVEAIGKETEGLRATIGRLLLSPNATNVVPSEVNFTLDLRHLEDPIRRRALGRTMTELQRIANRRGLLLTLLQEHDSPAIECAASLRQCLRQAVQEEGIQPVELPSGAGHDAMILADKVPMGMIFVRCHEGRSHCPEEHVEAADVAAAYAVMLRTIRQLASQENPS